jgi:hypothetical protein
MSLRVRGTIENVPAHKPVAIPPDCVTAARRSEPAVCAVVPSNASGRTIVTVAEFDMLNPSAGPVRHQLLHQGNPVAVARRITAIEVASSSWSRPPRAQTPPRTAHIPNPMRVIPT